MPENNYIIDHCRISGGSIYKNEKLFFEEKDSGAHDFLIAAYNHLKLQYPKFYKMDSLSKLGWLAAEVLMLGSSIIGDFKGEEIAVVLSNANSSLDTDIKYFQTTETFASPSLFVYTLPNIVIGEICIRHHLKGENAFFVSENFDPNFLEQYVDYLLNNNILQLCICGWVDFLMDDYKAVLFLVGKKPGEQKTAFTKENIDKIFQSQYGHTNS